MSQRKHIGGGFDQVRHGAKCPDRDLKLGTFVMLKNNVVLSAPCFENHQSEGTCWRLVTIQIRPKHFCVRPHSSCFWSWLASLQKKNTHIFHSNAPKTVPTLHFYPTNMSWNHEVSIISNDFLARSYPEKITRSNRGNRLIQIASLARSDLERYKRVERKSLGHATKILGGFLQIW